MKLYPTPDDAAVAAIREIVQTSIKERVEFAGRIFAVDNAKFSFTAPRRGTRDESDPGPKVAGRVNVGAYHTHGGEFDETDEIFSPKDKLKATFANELSYLGTPCQRILRYTPQMLLPAAEQAANPTGRVDVLVGVYTLREVVIEGSPGG
jgi:hypothetical protein